MANRPHEDGLSSMSRRSPEGAKAAGRGSRRKTARAGAKRVEKPDDYDPLVEMTNGGVWKQWHGSVAFDEKRWADVIKRRMKPPC